MTSSFAPNIRAQDLIKVLEQDGWSHDRSSGDHAIMTKDGEPRPISIRMGSDSSGGVTRDTLRIIERAIGRRVTALGYRLARVRLKRGEIPICVLYHDELYAVAEDHGDRYLLMSLDDGHRFSVLRKNCRIVEPEIPKEEEEEVSTEAEVRAEAREASVPILKSFTGIDTSSDNSDRDKWVILTQRYISTISVKIDQLENQIKVLHEQQDALKFSLDYVTGNTSVTRNAIEPVQEVEVRRTVLPSRKHGGKNVITPLHQVQIRELFNSGKKGNQIARELGLPVGTVYGRIKKLERE